MVQDKRAGLLHLCMLVSDEKVDNDSNIIPYVVKVEELLLIGAKRVT